MVKTAAISPASDFHTEDDGFAELKVSTSDTSVKFVSPRAVRALFRFCTNVLPEPRFAASF